MINTRDIYFKIDSVIVDMGFWEKDIEGKKQLIDGCLKQYIISKLREASADNYLPDNTQALSVCELLDLLNQNIPMQNKSEIFANFVHYIINVAGTMQGFSIIWYEEDDNELKSNPLIEIDSNELWNNIKTHKETDYYQVFCFIYDIFKNQFLKSKNAIAKKI